jgi:hypothetical protein
VDAVPEYVRVTVLVTDHCHCFVAGMNVSVYGVRLCVRVNLRGGTVNGTTFSAACIVLLPFNRHNKTGNSEMPLPVQ